MTDLRRLEREIVLPLTEHSTGDWNLDGMLRHARDLANERDQWRGSAAASEDEILRLRDQLAGAVDVDDPRVIGTLARVIENRHGTLHGIGDTLREALAEIKREAER